MLKAQNAQFALYVSVQKKMGSEIFDQFISFKDLIHLSMLEIVHTIMSLGSDMFQGKLYSLKIG